MRGELERIIGVYHAFGPCGLVFDQMFGILRTEAILRERQCSPTRHGP